MELEVHAVSPICWLLSNHGIKLITFTSVTDYESKNQYIFLVYCYAAATDNDDIEDDDDDDYRVFTTYPDQKIVSCGVRSLLRSSASAGGTPSGELGFGVARYASRDLCKISSVGPSPLDF
ncbi:hypothetical protein T265_06184 [Opisthorchis viverrini]|uniref:Uncharacterized protein n=1 Tax=Opisthorchis viverrini TaxID=6198 RepID=A0A074ZLE5_OPIVI|nr:hypothetical protein T265_06184 [Opisthorchis viverrini]KER26612.1 hypothetical protein T265_06184 [Opisthorchis viverrini]